MARQHLCGLKARVDGAHGPRAGLGPVSREEQALDRTHPREPPRRALARDALPAVHRAALTARPPLERLGGRALEVRDAVSDPGQDALDLLQHQLLVAHARLGPRLADVV